MMKFPINKRIHILACLLLAVLMLQGCTASPPQPPTDFYAEVSEDYTVNLSWEPVEDADSYRLYRRLEGEENFKFVTDTASTYYTDTSAATGCIYDYRLTALDSNGESEGALFTGIVIPDKEIPLSAPMITSVTELDAGTNVIFFSDENKNCDYEILRKVGKGDWTSVGHTTDRIFYDTTASKKSTCKYKVVVIGAKGQTAESEVVAEQTNPKEIFGVPVLMYHEFVTEEDLENGVAFDEYAIYDHEFEHDLKWLQKNGYTTITARELAQYLNGQGEMPEKPVILSIDDGKLGVYKRAYPLLQKYNMKAVLNVIGAEIDAATEAPELRGENPAPYSTWQELAEMSASGHVEIASHSYGLHVYQHDDRTGANSSADDTVMEFKLDAYADFYELQKCFKQYDIPLPTTFAYPYSVRSTTADKAWRMCGYEILLGGNMESVRTSRTNYFIQEAGLNDHSALLRRIARMHKTPIEDYIG